MYIPPFTSVASLFLLNFRSLPLFRVVWLGCECCLIISMEFRNAYSLPLQSSVLYCQLVDKLNNKFISRFHGCITLESINLTTAETKRSAQNFLYRMSFCSSSLIDIVRWSTIYASKYNILFPASSTTLITLPEIMGWCYFSQIESLIETLKAG